MKKLTEIVSSGPYQTPNAEEHRGLPPNLAKGLAYSTPVIGTAINVILDYRTLKKGDRTCKDGETYRQFPSCPEGTEEVGHRVIPLTAIDYLHIAETGITSAFFLTLSLYLIAKAIPDSINDVKWKDLFKRKIN